MGTGESRSPEKSIRLFLRDHSTHAAAGVGDIPGIARDKVDVEVGHSLPGGSADIDAYVPAVGVVLFLQEIAAAAEEVEEGGPFRIRRLEEGGDMPERDDEDVARVHREGVGPCIGEGIPQDDIAGRGVAERTDAACSGFVAHTGDFPPEGMKAAALYREERFTRIIREKEKGGVWPLSTGSSMRTAPPT